MAFSADSMMNAACPRPAANQCWLSSLLFWKVLCFLGAVRLTSCRFWRAFKPRTTCLTGWIRGKWFLKTTSDRWTHICLIAGKLCVYMCLCVWILYVQYIWVSLRDGKWWLFTITPYILTHISALLTCLKQAFYFSLNGFEGHAKQSSKTSKSRCDSFGSL